MIRIACIHGVNHSADERRDFAGWWGEHLNSRMAEPVECTPITWPSMDSTVLDTMKIVTMPGFRSSLYVTILQQLEEWRGEYTRDVILAHSMGTVLGLSVWRKCFADIPFVGIGSPLTHPLWGPLLGPTLKGTASSNVPVLFQNPQDPVASLGGVMYTNPVRRHARLVVSPHDHGHAWIGYLGNRSVQEAIRGG